MHVVFSTLISISDGIKINEQNKSGPLYLQSDFITPTERYVRFKPGGVSNVAILAQSMYKTPNVFYHTEMVRYIGSK